MKKKSLSVLFILISFLTAFARPVKRIKFPKGATEVTVKGQLNDFEDEQTYVIKLREDQTFEVHGIDENHIVSIYVTDPNGEDVNDLAADCHSNFSLPKTKAGDYKILVTECKKADPWQGSFKINVSAVDNK